MGDIFFLWKHSSEELLQLHTDLNDNHKSIKFEINYSVDQINFLDVTLYNANNKLYTILYVKPTDKK